jgi:hypothetical protein
MEDRFWNQLNDVPERVEEPGAAVAGASVRINGATSALEVGASFKETVVRLAKDAGFGKFRIFVGGEEVKPSCAPELITEGTRMEIRPFDPAA